MAREKVILQRDPAPVAYTAERFTLLSSLRDGAMPVLACLGAGAVYGSLARGDVHKGSDVDIVLTHPPAAFSLEVALETGGFQVTHREIVMASPNSPPKGLLELGEGRTISFPLLPMKRREEEFYSFGGLLDLAGLAEGRRVPGVDKRLLLIEPTDGGHVESGIVGGEAGVAKLLGIGRDVVDERVRVLTRRNSVGRTGVYLREALPQDVAFEGRLHDLASRDSSVKRQVRTRTGG